MSDETTPLAEAPAAETPVDLTTKIENPAAEAAAEPVKTEAPVGEVVETEAEETEGEGKKKIPGSQRLKNRLKLIESDYLAAQQEIERLRQATQVATPKTDGKPGLDREPTEADFPNDWLAYERAQTAWTARQAVRDEFNRVQEESRREQSQRVQTEHRREVLAAYEEYTEEVRERIPDFDKVLAEGNAKGVTVKQELADEILTSPKSALLQYHLAKNPDKVKELNGLSGRELAREIGRLEARVHLPTPKKATEANPPPSEVRGAAAPPVDPRTGPDDMNAYVAWRRKQAS